ncbi:MAG: Dabb family protein [Ruminococcus sp.]|nr:Dabb family protein [Ruminococcus sp.]
MVKHIIIWDFKDELTAEQKKSAAQRMKTELEALVGVIEGLKSLHVATDLLGSSNGDITLDSEFEDEKALAYYADHPEHVKIKEFVRTVVKARKCADYKI